MTIEGGSEVGEFTDSQEVSEFLEKIGLPPLESPLPSPEKGSFQSFLAAMQGATQTGGAKEFGLLGIFFHWYELHPEAKSCYELAMSMDPTDFRWPHYLGYLAYKELDIEKAKAGFDRSRERNPENAAVYMQLGRIWKEEGENRRVGETVLSQCLQIALGQV